MGDLDQRLQFLRQRVEPLKQEHLERMRIGQELGKELNHLEVSVGLVEELVGTWKETVAGGERERLEKERGYVQATRLAKEELSQRLNSDPNASLAKISKLEDELNLLRTKEADIDAQLGKIRVRGAPKVPSSSGLPTEASLRQKVLDEMEMAEECVSRADELAKEVNEALIPPS